MSGSPKASTTFVIEASNLACPVCRVPFGYREPNITVRQSLGATLRGFDVLAFEIHPVCASRVDIARDKDLRDWCNAVAACDMATKMGLGIRTARLMTGLELDSGLLPKPSATR